MTIDEAINRIDGLRHNFYTKPDKIEWLSRVDHTVFNDIICTHEDPAIDEFEGYTEDTPGDTELLIPAPYNDVYGYFMESMIDYYNGEYDQFNNTSAMYQQALSAYRNYYNRNHMPVQVEKVYF